MRFGRAIRQVARSLHHDEEITFNERLQLAMASTTFKGRQQVALAVGEYLDANPGCVPGISILPKGRNPEDWTDWFEQIDWEQVLEILLTVLKIVIPIILMFL